MGLPALPLLIPAGRALLPMFYTRFSSMIAGNTLKGILTRGALGGIASIEVQNAINQPKKRKAKKKKSKSKRRKR